MNIIIPKLSIFSYSMIFSPFILITSLNLSKTQLGIKFTIFILFFINSIFIFLCSINEKDSRFLIMIIIYNFLSINEKLYFLLEFQDNLNNNINNERLIYNE